MTPLGPTQSIRNTCGDDYDLDNECENWFHPQCIVLKRNLANIREDEPFYCPDCKGRIKKMKPEGLDISNIIGDINGIGGTRRSRYISPIN